MSPTFAQSIAQLDWTTMNIQDVAQRIGVSPTTISRTLSGRGRISERTRSRVLAQMKELGYTPNLNARRLIEGRSMTIALDWGSGSPDSPLDDVYMAQLVEGILHALQEQGYGLLLTPPGNSNLVEHWVRGQAVDGVLLLGGGSLAEDTRLAESMLSLGAPTVVIGHQPLPTRPRLGSVVIDLAVGMAEVARHLVEQGHRNIAFVGSRAGDAGLDGIQAALAESGLALPADRIRIAESPEAAESVALELLRGPAPTALIARTDNYALHILRTVRRAGWRVPEDVSIVGHDDISLAALYDPPLTTVRIDCTRLGQAAATTLLEILDAPETLRPPVVHPTRLVQRGTVAPPPTHRKGV